MLSRSSVAKPRPRLVSRATACAELGCSASTFWRRWDDVFTDPRPATERGPKNRRMVFADELTAAVTGGRAAVALVRQNNNRG